MNDFAYEVLGYFAEQDRPISASELRGAFNNHPELDNAIASLKSNEYIKESKQALFTYFITHYGKHHLKELQRRLLSRINVTKPPTKAPTKTGRDIFIGIFVTVVGGLILWWIILKIEPYFH